MSKLNFPEGITRKLIESTDESGFIPPVALKLLTRYTDRELTAVRNCYRVMTGGSRAIGGGDNLCSKVEMAAARAKDPDLKRLNERLLFLSRNDRQIDAGLRGAFACISYALKTK